MVALSLILCSSFLVLAAIHFNWVFGGQWGLAQALPTKENGERVLSPKKFGSFVVGIGLTAFGCFYFVKSGWVAFQFPNWMMTFGGWIIPAIFILRAIGDFQYVGFFKKIKQTEFGRSDSRFHSPLCLALGVIGLLIQVMH